jgi:hypothetical protein
MRNPLPQLRKLQRYGLLLGLLLLLGQTTSLLHAHDLDKHAHSAHCHLCLHSTAHDHGLVGSLSIVPVVAIVGSIISESVQHSFTSIFSANYQSRAPPRFS